MIAAEPNVAGGLAIIAGSGDLPRLIAEKCQREGRDYHVLLFSGAEFAWTQSHPVLRFEYEKLGRVFKQLKALSYDRIVLAGKVARPSLSPLKFDAKTLSLAPKILKSLNKGDNQTLGLVTGLLEAEGFQVIGAHELLMDTLARNGQWTKAGPSEDDQRDIERALEIATAMGTADIGQAIVVAQGLCLGVETLQGTDALLRFVADTAEGLRPDPDGSRGVLYKGPKPGQDWRVDLPVIGVETLQGASNAGLAGIAVQAGGVMVLDPDAVIRLADELGLFLIGLEPG